MYWMTHAMTYLDGNFWKIMNCDSAIVIALKGIEMSNASLWCRMYKSIIIARLVGFAIEWSQFTFDLSRATHYIRIMDSRNFFPIFELLCLSFWLIMFFSVLDHVLFGVDGHALMIIRVFDADGLSRPQTSTNQRKS